MVPLRTSMQLSRPVPIHLLPFHSVLRVISFDLPSHATNSRGPAPPRAPPLHPARPAQLPLPDSARPALLRRAPPRHLRPFLSRLQLAHRLRGTRPRSSPRSQIGGCRRQQRRRCWWWRRNEHRRCVAQHRAAVGRLLAAGKVVSRLLEAEARACAPLLPVWALCA